MHWPGDHPLTADPALTPFRAAAEALCDGRQAGPVLRHVAGRRVALRVHHGDGEAVLKVFARPRARGNERRLRLIAAADRDAAPPPLGCDPGGHAGLVGWQPGMPFTDLPDDRLPAAARAAGVALRRLHAVDVVLDRTWGPAQEIAALRAAATPPVAALLDDHPWSSGADAGPLVCSHRDFHPGQVVVDGDRARIIDLDDATQAPAGLDVGNFTAHLRRDGALGTRPADVTAAAVAAFLSGYGAVPRDLAAWEDVSLLRLAALAERRFARPGDAARILALRAERS